MNDSERGQVNRSAAEVYEAFFVPALFQAWADPVARAAKARTGHRALDVGCGTGVAARALAVRVGASGKVSGLDVNEGMLTVARTVAPDIDWRQGAAEALPFEDGSFDAVVSQFALMFFEDKVAALAEMMRVLQPGGTMVVAVWDALENTPGYAAMVALLQRLFGDAPAEALRAPYSMGQPEVLEAFFDEAGIRDVTVSTRPGTARFPSLASWVHTDIKGWTLADMIGDEQMQRLLEEARIALKPFVMSDGRIEFNAPAHLVMVTKAPHS